MCALCLNSIHGVRTQSGGASAKKKGKNATKERNKERTEERQQERENETLAYRKTDMFCYRCQALMLQRVMMFCYVDSQSELRLRIKHCHHHLDSRHSHHLHSRQSQHLHSRHSHLCAAARLAEQELPVRPPN